MYIDRLTLPISNVVIQYREDGKHLVARSEKLPMLYGAEDRGISIWNDPDDKAMIAFEEEFAGDVAHPTWWVISGTADPDIEIRVTIDGENVSDPHVYRVGNVWACEWVSLPAIAHIHRSDRPDSRPIKFRRPNFLPPAPHPDKQIDERS